MPNDFFVNDDSLASGLVARASAVNALLDQLETGMDKLPTHATFKNGFIHFVDAAGSANAYTAALTKGPSTYTNGLTILIKINATSTGASTINVDSMGAKSIKYPSGDALDSGALVANALYILTYDSTLGYFVLVTNQQDWEQRSLDFVDVAGTTHTLTASDNGKMIRFNNASACTLTLPQASTEALTRGFHASFYNASTGSVTLATEGSDTLGGDGTALAVPSQSIAMAFLDTAGSPNAWRAQGDLV